VLEKRLGGTNTHHGIKCGYAECEARAGERFLGRGNEPCPAAPPHQLEGLGSAVSSHSGVWGKAPENFEFRAFLGLENHIKTAQCGEETLLKGLKVGYGV